MAISALGLAGLNAGFNFITDLFGQKQQNKNNLELAKYSFDRSMEAWREQSEYNSPLNQLKRYQEAGLNPNLIYGQMNEGNASSAPQMSTPTSGRVSPIDLLGQYSQIQNLQADMEVKQAQAENLRAAARNQAAQTAYNNSRQVAQDLQNKLQAFNNQLIFDNKGAYSSAYLSRFTTMSFEAKQAVAKYNSLVLTYDIAEYLYQNGYYRNQISLQNSLNDLRSSQSKITSAQANLWSMGINPNDNTILRQLGMFLKSNKSAIRESLDNASGFWDAVGRLASNYLDFVMN
ncbi:DNA pilot protein [Tortoise microvirus 96]|nr:DNA pilot protein [Tortoise microvirus 96]QPB07387.1 MAG: DNA pilot protein [Microvirus sp.]